MPRCGQCPAQPSLGVCCNGSQSFLAGTNELWRQLSLIIPWNEAACPGGSCQHHLHIWELPDHLWQLLQQLPAPTLLGVRQPHLPQTLLGGPRNPPRTAWEGQNARESFLGLYRSFEEQRGGNNTGRALPGEGSGLQSVEMAQSSGLRVYYFPSKVLGWVFFGL